MMKRVHCGVQQQKGLRNHRLALVLLAALALLLASCQGGDAPETAYGILSVRATWSSGEQPTAASPAFSPLVQPPSVVLIRVIISGPGISPDIQKDFSASLGSGQIPNVPIGTGRTLIMQGINGSSLVIYEGTTTGLTVVGGVNPTVPVTLTPAFTPPNPVTSFTATGGNAQVALGWSNPAGIAGVMIRRSTTGFVASPGEGTLVLDDPTATQTALNDASLTNGILYYYSAYTYDSDGVFSTPVTGSDTPADVPPDAPGTLFATADDGQVSLLWSAPSSGSVPTGYNVFRGTAPGVSVAGAPHAALSLQTTHIDSDTVVNGTTYYYKVTATNTGGDGPPSNEAFDTPQDATAPTVSTTSPLNAATNVPINTAISVTFSEAMNTTATEAAFSISPDPGGAFAWDPGNTILTYTPSVNLQGSTPYTVTIGVGAMDVVGNNLAAPYNFGFTTGSSGDSTPPTVTTTNPTDGATAVPLNPVISVTFSEPMNKTTVQAAFSISSSPGGSFAWGLGDTLLTFNLVGPLTASTLYTVTIGTGAMDVAGNPLASIFSYSFTTGSGGDSTAPTVTGNTPGLGDTGVPLNTSVTVIFTEAMHRTSVENAFSTSPTVPGTFAWSGDSQALVFTPDSNLTLGTTYTITVGTGASDVAGNTLASAFNFGFTTGGLTDDLAPTVSSNDPLDLASDISVTTTISVTFDEAMNTAATQNAFSLSPLAAGSFAWSVGNTVLTFTPASDLAYETLYTATVGTGATDLAGNPLGGAPVSFGFTTEPESKWGQMKWGQGKWKLTP